MCGSRPRARSISIPESQPTRSAWSNESCSPSPTTASAARWPASGAVDEAQLAAAIRAGELDGGSEQVQSALRALVGRRLAAAHPGYQDE